MSFQKESWTPASLEQADLVVISGPLAVDRDSLIAKGVDHYWWSDEGRQDAFTSDESLVLIRWIRGGGNLLLIVDHAGTDVAADTSIVARSIQYIEAADFLTPRQKDKILCLNAHHFFQLVDVCGSDE